MRATECFKRGDKAQAKSLGEEGRRLNALMKARHRAAALAIFASRNPSDKRIYNQGILDLHALHVAEAIEALETLLPDIYFAGHTTEATITGTGKHSGSISRNLARLHPSLQTYFDELITAMKNTGTHTHTEEATTEREKETLFVSIKDPSGYEGGFRVKLSKQLMEHWGVL